MIRRRDLYAILMVMKFEEEIMLELRELEIKGRAVKYSKLNYQFSKQVYHITGANGSGKSSLFETLVKEVEYSGMITLGNEQLSDIPIDTLHSQYIAYVRQDSNLITCLTVAENIELLVDSANGKIDYYLELFDIKGFAHIKVSQLSGGELKKVNLAIGLAKNCPILILDEPDNHLDELSVKNLYNCINQYDGLVLLTTHNTKLTNNFITVDLSNLNQMESSNMKQLSKAKNSSLSISSKLVKKLKVKSLLTINLLLIIIFGCFLWHSYSVQNAVNSFFNPTGGQAVYNDNALLIQPPIYNNMLYSYGTKEWFDKTPYLLGQDVILAIDQSGLANETIGLNEDVTVSQSRVEYQDETYYFEFASAPSYPKAITENIHTFTSSPDTLDGAIPDDYSNQVIIPKRLAESENLAIGDTMNLTAKSGEKTHDFSYEVVGINNNDLATEIELSYNGDEYFAEDNVNKSKQAKQDAIDLIVANSAQTEKEISNQITDQNYYKAIYVEAGSKQQAIELINKLYEYDPYLSIQSNHDQETGQIASYKRKLTIKWIRLVSIILVSVTLILIILKSFEDKIFQARYTSVLVKSGFSKKEIKKLLTKNNARHLNRLKLILILNILFALIYHNMQMGLVISIEMIAFITLISIIESRKINEN